MVWAPTIFAASYNVNASVPFPAPTQPAVIDAQLNGLNTASNTVEIFGTCQAINPVAIVSIWRSGASIGSVNCESNGTFRLTVGLVSGLNTLIARTSSISEAYGPDSSSLSITYTPAQPSSPGSAPQSTSPSTPNSNLSQSSEAIPGTNQLNIRTPSTFTLMDQKNTVATQVEVNGGQNPYTITINWGDGVTETKVVNASGIYTFEHTFEKQGSYKAIAKVTDVLGSSVDYQFAIVSEQPQPASQTATNTTEPGSDTGDSVVARYFLPAAIAAGVLGISAIALSGFWIGQHVQSQNKPKSKPKPRKRTAPRKRVSK